MLNFFESSLSSRWWRGSNLNNLNIDEAYLNLTSSLQRTVRVYSLSSDCVQCPFSYVTSLNGSSQSIHVSTKHDSIWRFYKQADSVDSNDTYKVVDDKKDLLCQIRGGFDEFGKYDIIVNERNCENHVRVNPVNIYFPLLVVFVGLFLLYVFVRLAGLCLRRIKKERNPKQETVADESTKPNENKRSSRILSIDTFRGFSLCFMIFVNDGGGQYWFFNHSTWDGLYPADLLFPWFLWIMGVCIPLSQKTLAKESQCIFSLTWNVLRRSAVLFLLGLSLNTLGVGPIDLFELRIPGVLQRIAVCYAVVSLISILTWKIQVKVFGSSNEWTILLSQWLVHIGILYAHYHLTFFLPVPACPQGYLGAGGIQSNSLYANCTGGATGYLDRLLLGESHMYRHAAVRRVYQAPVLFDPENILGCLTSIFHTFLGTQAGFILSRSTSTPASKIRHLLIWSAVLLSPGLILHYSNAIPLNRNLWSLSFVFTSSALAFFVFTLFYYTIDHHHLWDGSPFIYPGMNSVLVYVGHEICFQLFPWHWRIDARTMNTHFLQLVENTWGVILWIIITYILFEKRIFFNV